jgi:hypothetical protein
MACCYIFFPSHLDKPWGLTGLACEVNDIDRKPQEPPLIGNPRFLKRGGGQCYTTVE